MKMWVEQLSDFLSVMEKERIKVVFPTALERPYTMAGGDATTNHAFRAPTDMHGCTPSEFHRILHNPYPGYTPSGFPSTVWHDRETLDLGRYTDTVV